jgi:hypothetical protein
MAKLFDHHPEVSLEISRTNLSPCDNNAALHTLPAWQPHSA